MRNLTSLLVVIFLVACSAQVQSGVVPAPYQNASPPEVDFLTNGANIEAGQDIFNHHCATCHGESGRGKGLAGHELFLKPANLADPMGVAQKYLDYWFWRVSEGGTVEPFHANGSVMLAWKHHLSETENAGR